MLLPIPPAQRRQAEVVAQHVDLIGLTPTAFDNVATFETDGNGASPTVRATRIGLDDASTGFQEMI